MKESGSGSNQQLKSNSQKKAFSLTESMPSSNFYDPIIYRPQILENPQGNSKKLMSFIFNPRFIGKIKMRENYLEIQVKRRTQRTFQRQLYEYQKFKGRNQEQNEYNKSGDSNISIELCLYMERIISEPGYCSLLQFGRILKTMEENNFIAWHLPFTKDGPRLKSLVLSKKSLSLMGFRMEEAALDLIQYQEHSFEIMDNLAYRDFFLFYIDSLKNFLKGQNSNGETGSGSSGQSRKCISNTMIGKNQRPINVQILMSMPTPFIICIQILRVIKRDKAKEQSQERKQNGSKYTSQTQKCLQNVLRFKQIERQRQNSLKICGYIEIFSPESSKSKKN